MQSYRQTKVASLTWFSRGLLFLFCLGMAPVDGPVMLGTWEGPVASDVWEEDPRDPDELESTLIMSETVILSYASEQIHF